MSTLYLVGTPIGNLEDISARALRVLAEVALIAAEDTRVTAKLLRRYAIETPMVSYHDFSAPEMVDRLLDALAQGDIALVSDAGMPGLSDPGYRLVRAAIDARITVVPVPGPSAVLAALVASGLPTDRFLFLGFLPRQKERRQSALADVASMPYTLVLFEAPHRLLDLLRSIQRELGDRNIAIGRELTKIYEEMWRGPVSRAVAHFDQQLPRGEFTIVIEGADETLALWSRAKVLDALRAEIGSGLSRSEAAAAISEISGWRRRDLYQLSLELS